MKIETIVEPNEQISAIAQRYMEIAVSTLPGRHIEMVGAMAVPMVGRPELDILIITDDVEGDAATLETVGFGHRGSGDDALYLKQMVEGVEVTVQIMRPDNALIPMLRGTVKLLRDDHELRSRYEAFKKTLSGLPRDEYKKKKVAWMKENVLPRIGR